MLGEGLEIGDIVELSVNAESRGWGYNPGPDGMRLRVVGFAETHYTHIMNFGHKPGVYKNKCWIRVEFPDGHLDTIGTHGLAIVDKHLYNMRLDAWRENRNKEHDYIRPLPETSFHEGDEFTSDTVCSIFGYPHDTTFKVEVIHYNSIGELRDDGSRMPEYDFRHPTGGTSPCNEADMELVSRGNVWKHFHGEKINFINIEEEARFFDMIGDTEEVKNPLTGNYSWNKDEVLAAIKVGFAHGMKGHGSFLGGGTVYAIRFKDEDLGKLVAAYTLTMFHKDPGYLY